VGGYEKEGGDLRKGKGGGAPNKVIGNRIHYLLKFDEGGNGKLG